MPDTIKVEKEDIKQEDNACLDKACQTDEWNEERMIKYRKMKRKLVDMINVSFFFLSVALLFF